MPGRGAFLVHPCQGRFRAPARGPFGTAQKGRKGRLGAAAPKDPFDVQQSAIVSYRRVDIAFPLRPLPGLRPSRVGSQAISPLIPRLLQRVTGTGLSPAGQRQTISSKRNREATTLLSWWLTVSQAGRRTTESAGVGRYSFYRYRFSNKPLHDPVPKIGVLRGGTPKRVFGNFLHEQKVTPRRAGTLLYRQDRRQQQAAPGRETPRPRNAGTPPPTARLPKQDIGAALSAQVKQAQRGIL